MQNPFLQDLVDLNRYALSILQNDKTNPDTFYPKKKYLYGQFALAISLIDGMIVLAENRQARSIAPVFRTLLEVAVNVDLVQSERSHVWLYNMIASNEVNKHKKLNNLETQGALSPELHAKGLASADSTIRFIRSRHKEIPMIPGVFTKALSIDRKLTFIDKCRVIDYYLEKKGKAPFLSSKLHDNIYSFLSETTHANPSVVDDIFHHDKEGILTIDISGSDKDILPQLTKSAYILHYQLVKMILKQLNNPRQLLRDDIKQARRRVMRT